MKEVVCALIVHKGKLLITQHGVDSGHPWKWEFPGGKIQSGESREEALIREIREELEIGIRIELPLIPITHAYEAKVIRLNPFLCRWTGGIMELTEHHNAKWVSPEDISKYDLLDADHKMFEEGDNFSRLLSYAGGQG